MTNASDALPLSGIKVLDFSQNLPGPYATFLLAGWGAEVIKVEPPKGDPGRFMEPFFSMVNRGKRSIVLDLRDPASRAPLEALVRWADVLVEGFRPGVMERLGCSFERARELNPRIVYCSITGFGRSGPLAHIAGHDLVIQALTGLMGCAPDGEAPVPGFQAADFAGSLYAVIGIQAALAQRAQTGVGCEVDLAMFEALFHMCFIPLSSAFARMAGYSGEPRMESFGGNPRYATYRTKDGRRVAISRVADPSHRETAASSASLRSLTKKLTNTA